MRRLVNELTKLPSIGEKSALRLAYYLVTDNRDLSHTLAAAIANAKDSISTCKCCYCLTEGDSCPLCEDTVRDRNLICVVEKPADVFALERSGGYRGVYHVLHGLWSPLKGITPESIRIPELVARVKALLEPTANEQVEILIATGTTVEGDATAMFIAQALNALGVRVTRIAQGLPKGGELEFADDLTLHQAIEGRRSF
jgi:recombination protein RecR